ncbi:aminotransferase class IV family protein [Campylobacter fetus]|uniref:aminotransferase class IV family protein n=1 Tax=Campylobacter fetus TaxID=196 RepID=UPI0003C260D4|nr:aminotransferase class IV family protein [Campylobacter fetus]AGZ81938.1 branched-chain amino acid aminotransferase, possible 4-amino-4-deoxychorismate lyase PabC [Campylobacter fetus subsp. testudinum 03-427]AJB45675.1 aminotransferase [Campylobacter fetus subsp. testudinum]EAI4321807.1 aminotransferase [Campylobacter fetus]EAI4390847.1 aminotransferase [Campylobacter fetus]OCR88538.1 aminotransferase [Campylobacter fetus subsp. testudinum]
MNSYKKSIFLFETIKIIDKEVCNLNFHIKRAKNSTINGLKFDFSDILQPPFNGTLRAKVIYDINGNLKNVEYFPYEMRDFYEFKLVNIDFDYDKKYLDRSKIEAAKSNFNEIIMIKNGLITDTSIANIAVFDSCNDTWLTPKTPLLKGTTRDRLLQNKFLKQKDIDPNDLLKAKRFAIMNAMIGFLELKLFKFSY